MKKWITYLVIAAVLAVASILGSVVAEPLMAQGRATLSDES